MKNNEKHRQIMKRQMKIMKTIFKIMKDQRKIIINILKIMKLININMDFKKTWIWSFRGFSTN